MSWAIEHHRGSAADFHGRPMPELIERTVWVHHVDRPALVLGSAQSDEVVDRARAGRLGVEVVPRRSGGGAVLLTPDDVLWVDVLVPVGDPQWDGDVGRSMQWLGRIWADVLGPLAAVHQGALMKTTWSSLVCFAGLGPGEVTIGGRKAVGISQRRTRAGSRFQCALYRRHDSALLVDLLAEPRPSADEIVVHEVIDRPLGAVLDAFLALLP